MAGHPNKHIREAMKFAETEGWRFVKASGHAHIYGTMYCPRSARVGCRFRVYSTPTNPEEHAQKLIREVKRCPHE